MFTPISFISIIPCYVFLPVEYSTSCISDVSTSNIFIMNKIFKFVASYIYIKFLMEMFIKVSKIISCYSHSIHSSASFFIKHK